MVVSKKTSMDRRENPEICTIQKDWGPLVNCKPVLTPDSRHLLAASGCSVKVFSTASGSLIQEFIGHRHKVIGIVQHDNQYVTCDTKGEMRTWSSEKQECLEKVSLLPEDSQNTGQVVAFQILKECQQVLLLVKKTSKKKGLLMKFSRPFGKGSSSVLAKDVQLGQGKVGSLEVTYCPLYLTLHMAGTRPFTCLVWNPRQEMLATGDITGRIVLWYNLTNTVPAQTILHWHTLPVEDLAFSVLGNELYSGGGECVLVKWLLPEDRRHYLPRLGMPIKTITTDASNSLVITGHTDNAFTVIASKTNKVQGNIQDLSINLESSESFPAGIVSDPKTGAIVLNGRTGHVQLYDIHHNKQLYHLDITQTNYITKERHQVIYNTQVIRMAMSADGLWLATIEYRDDFQTSIEQRVKFWHYSIVDQNWYLDTSVEMPHDKCINGIVFKPSTGTASSPEFVTCSDDGKFKVWEIVKDANIYQECRDTFPHQARVTSGAAVVLGSTDTFQPQPVNISHDGSLIAAGFANILTLWLPQSCHLKGTLSQPYLKEHIKQIEFGRGEGCGSLLVTRTDSWICSWDLFTCTLSWRVGLQSTCMAADPRSSHMAVFSKDSCVFIFEPNSSEPICWKRNINPAEITCAAFIPRQTKLDSEEEWNVHSNLVFIDKDQTLRVLEEKSSQLSVDGRAMEIVKHFEQETLMKPAATPFAALVAQTRTSHAGKEKSSQKGSAAFGVQVENSMSFIQKMMNDARVYRMEAFAGMTANYCNLLIPAAVTSEEKQVQQMKEEQLRQTEMQRKKTKKLAKKKKKDLERVPNADFSELLEMLS
ncbi:WD repeat-containing protein 75-like [Penaeus chinensis]|uniref:WD repeat-containing protein 75-like n=1 Tax=Penaeus chinensis TaxID=139456 RepID=UPI001FB59439|nr:WD repeat-containing protein 75-like [Penaeus chinensis]